jgi:hypothetical protein
MAGACFMGRHVLSFGEERPTYLFSFGSVVTTIVSGGTPTESGEQSSLAGSLERTAPQCVLNVSLIATTRTPPQKIFALTKRFSQIALTRRARIC